MPTPIIAEKNAETESPTGYDEREVDLNFSVPVVLTADVPVASASMDSRILIEQTTPIGFNLVFYMNSERYKIDLTGLTF